MCDVRLYYIQFKEIKILMEIVTAGGGLLAGYNGLGPRVGLNKHQINTYRFW